MIARPRVYFALSFMAAGVILAPLVRSKPEQIDWRAMADAYEDPIFSDGFEDGTTGAWTVTITAGTATLVFSEGSPMVKDILQSMDSFGRAWVPTAILMDAGYSGRGLNAGPNTLVDDCSVTFAGSGSIVISFALPGDVGF